MKTWTWIVLGAVVVLCVMFPIYPLIGWAYLKGKITGKPAQLGFRI